MKKVLVIAWLALFCAHAGAMAATPSAVELKRLAQAGASLVINASGYTATELLTIAQALESGCTLTIQNAGKLNASQCLQIIRAKPGQVIFWY